MLYYQVQYQKLDKTWHPFGEAEAIIAKAKDRFLNFLLTYDAASQTRALRLATVWQCWDKEWRIKEIIDFKEFV